MISLQSEIVQALQIAKAVETASLDVPTIHESSITNRKDAIRAMDDLCQRITSRMPGQSSYSEDPYERRSHTSAGSPPQPAPPEYTTLRRMASDDSESFAMFPGTVSLHGQSNAEFKAFQRMQSSRQQPSTMSQREAYRTTYASAFSWQTGSDSPRPSYDLRSLPFRRPRVQEEFDDDGRKHQDFPEMDRLSQWSVQDSALGSDLGSKHLTAASLGSMTGSDRNRASSVSEQSAVSQEKQEKPEDQKTLIQKRPFKFGKRSSSLASKALPPRPVEDEDDENNLTPGSETSSISSRTAGPSLSVESRSVRSDKRDEIETVAPLIAQSVRAAHSRGSPSRAEYAPEVVTKEFESMLSLKPNRAPTVQKASSSSIHSRSTVRKPYNYVESIEGPEPDAPWIPLPRPARHNNYHGFCKGSWQIRKSVQEGLSVKMIPSESGSIMVPHWCCKLCDFRSKALNQNALPDQIYFNKKCGVRYRWLFLAKCHTPAVGS